MQLLSNEFVPPRKLLKALGAAAVTKSTSNSVYVRQFHEREIGLKLGYWDDGNWLKDVSVASSNARSESTAFSPVITIFARILGNIREQQIR